MRAATYYQRFKRRGRRSGGEQPARDAKLTLEALFELVEEGSSRAAPKPLNLPRTLPSPPNSPMTASEVYAAVSELRPENAIVVQESPSNVLDLAMWRPTVKPASYYSSRGAHTARDTSSVFEGFERRWPYGHRLRPPTRHGWRLALYRSNRPRDNCWRMITFPRASIPMR